MLVNSTSQFLAKIMAIVLLGAVSKTWVLMYLLGDLGLFLLYTILRNDFFYCIPMRSTIGSIANSLLLRTSTKVRSYCRAQKLRFTPLNTTPPD
jgi:hypothetical protein